MTKLTGVDAYVFMVEWLWFLVICAVLHAIPVWILWNWLAPMVFGLSKITLFQAWGLLFLSALLLQSRSTTTVNTNAQQT